MSLVDQPASEKTLKSRFCTMLGIVLCMVSTSEAVAQFSDPYRATYLSVSTSYLELKAEANHGLVFKGPDVVLDFGVKRLNPDRYLDYSASLGGGGKTTIGTWGFRWALSPVNIAYAFNIYRSNERAIYLGPAFSVSYNLQNYPDLHTGYLDWMTDFSLGAHLLSVMRVGRKNVFIESRASLLSLVSRPDSERDPYYFSLKAGDVISDMHSNLRFLTAVDHFKGSLSVGLFVSSRSFLGYEFRFVGFSGTPEFHQLSHAVRYTVHMGTSRGRER